MRERRIEHSPPRRRNKTSNLLLPDKKHTDDQDDGLLNAEYLSPRTGAHFPFAKVCARLKEFLKQNPEQAGKPLKRGLKRLATQQSLNKFTKFESTTSLVEKLGQGHSWRSGTSQTQKEGEDAGPPLKRKATVNLYQE